MVLPDDVLDVLEVVHLLIDQPFGFYRAGVCLLLAVHFGQQLVAAVEEVPILWQRSSFG